MYQALLREEESVAKSRVKKLASNKQKLDTVRHKIESLYDEKFEKGMDEDIFNTMYVRYAKEKTTLENELAILEAEVGKTRSMEDNIGFWMDAIKNALNIDSLTREILSSLIDHIVVYEREKVDGETRQRVEIFYKFVGNLSGTSEQKNSTTKPSLTG